MPWSLWDFVCAIYIMCLVDETLKLVSKQKSGISDLQYHFIAFVVSFVVGSFAYLTYYTIGYLSGA